MIDRLSAFQIRLPRRNWSYLFSVFWAPMDYSKNETHNLLIRFDCQHHTRLATKWWTILCNGLFLALLINTMYIIAVLSYSGKQYVIV